LCNVLVGRLKQSEPDCRIKGRQVIKHNLVANPDQLGAAQSNQSSSYLAVKKVVDCTTSDVGKLETPRE